MAKKFFGIDISQQYLRVVTATLVEGVPVVTSTREQRVEANSDRSRVLAEMIGEVAFGDRVAACLPAVGSYFRQLEFPFGEAKKIESALDLEMKSQLPISDDMVCDFHTPRPVDHVFEVPAAAVKRVTVTDMLEIFQQAEKPLHLLDLNPFAYASGLSETVIDGVLAVIMASEMTIAYIKAGQVLSCRAIPRPPQDNAERLAFMIQRDYLTLSKSNAENPPPLFLIGEGAGPDLFHALKEIGLVPLYPSLEFNAQQIAPALLPAAALALRAALPGRIRQFNFLKGNLAPKSEWTEFRQRLIVITVLTGLSLILAVSGAYLNYMHQQKQAEMLQKESIAIFRQTFPQVQTIVDVPNQMQVQLNELREKAHLLGLDQSRSALNVLREISARIPKEINFDVKELIVTGDQLHIDGSTSSFEAINKLSQALEASPLFEQSQIADAKMGQNNDRVDFRIDLKISAEELPQ